MKKTITMLKQGQEDMGHIFTNEIETEMLFIELQKDTIGRSGSNPKWGYVYSKENGKLKYKGIGLHKEYDYDYPHGAHAEKVWSIMGKELLPKSVRVPDIDLVGDKIGYEEVISYRIMDNDKEDMIHFKDMLYNKYQRDEINVKKDIYKIEEILECIKIQVPNEQNYKEIEKNIMKVLLLDSVTNNADRHAFNWALVREKETNKYSLAVFDHAIAFINMFETREYLARDGWCSTYITVGNDTGKYSIGSSGEAVVRYISEKYPKYFEEFTDTLNKKMPEVLQKIKQEKLNIDFNRLSRKLEEKRHYFSRVKDRGELEYE